jgi:putative two-component system response regulator
MSETILFVDDEQNVLNALKRLFADTGLKTVFTQSPLQALELCRTDQIALLVSDNMMPEMKGVELLARVKTESPSTVKILMTAFADLPTALEAINSGEVFRFIVKPWENNGLMKAVSEGMARYRIMTTLQHENEGVLRSLAQTIELKDHYTRGHCERVAGYAMAVCNELSLSPETCRAIRHGSWLHDCGKIGIPETILNSCDVLSDQERDIMKQHPDWGANVAEQAHLSPIIINIIRHHHERVDGTGYPQGLKGENIPLEARIVGVADVYDALTSRRSYKEPFSMEKAGAILEEMKDNALDGTLVDIFLKAIKPKG